MNGRGRRHELVTTLVLLISLVVSLAAPLSLSADASPIISLVAGNGESGYAGDGGAATAAALKEVCTVAVDGAGRVYIADDTNHCIRVVDAAGIITTFAGDGTPSFSGDGGAATAAQLQYPSGVAVDAGGNVYIADRIDHRIRMVPAANGTFFGQAMQAGHIYTIAGTGTAGYNVDGILATTAQLNRPRNVAVDASGNVYIADTDNHRIRRVDSTTGIITTVVGTGVGGAWIDGNSATTSGISSPYDVDISPSGHILVAMPFRYAIAIVPSHTGTYFGRSMAAGCIYTLAGMINQAGDTGDGGAANAAKLSGTAGVAADVLGNVFIADTGNNRVRVVTAATGDFWGQEVESGYIYAYAGTGTAGYSGDDGQALDALLNGPYGVGTDTFGRVFVADRANRRVRQVTPGPQTVAISLQGGWNMVSLPVVPEDNSVPEVFPGIVAIYTWDPVAKSYVSPTSVVPGAGYWVASTTSRTIPVTGMPLYVWTRACVTGWNMIGSVYGEPLSKTGLNDHGANAIQRDAIYWWNPQGKSYEVATTIEEGRGYWLAATAHCSLTLAPAI